MTEDIRLVFVGALSRSQQGMIRPQFEEQRKKLLEEILKKYENRRKKLGGNDSHAMDIVGLGMQIQRLRKIGTYPVEFQPDLLLALQNGKLAGFLDSMLYRSILHVRVHYIDPSFRSVGTESLWQQMVWKAIQTFRPELLKYAIAKTGKTVVLTREQMKTFQPAIPVRLIKDPAPRPNVQLKPRKKHQQPANPKGLRRI